MTDVVIRRCTLRIVRHGGWSWGPDRRALLAQATAALPPLIAERLAELMPDVEGEIAEPVRLRFAVRAGQLIDNESIERLIASSLTPDALPIHSLLAQRAASEAAERASLPSSGMTPKESVAAADAPSAPMPSAKPIEILLRWREQAELWQRLQGFSFRALGLWLHALLRELSPAPAQTELTQTLRDECVAIQRALPAGGDVWLHAARARLAIAVELSARHERAISSKEVAALLEELVPMPEGEVPMSEPHALHEGMPQESASRLGAQPSVSAPPGSVTPRGDKAAQPHAEVKLCSVLPFLALGALHRLGWLDVASATFSALQDADNGATFAAALACKTLPGPQRGWHRSDDVLRTAAAFAGLPATPSSAELASWARQASGGLSPLDDFVVSELARGHELHLPLLVMRVESRYEREWLLFDADGGFPVTWQKDESTLLAHLRRFGPCVVMVSTAAATRTLMRGLAEDGRSFVTTAMPSREDNWQRIRGTPCWAGGPQTTMRKLMDAVALLPEIEAQALSVTRDLLDVRPAATSHIAAELEHSAALAAATGLGAIAWTLWRKRETVHPLLALERFANLDGTARTTADAVEIRPSFGRRYLDLQQHGLFADIPAPPWLHGKRVVFAGP